MIVFDIETVPLTAALATAYPAVDRSPPANYKSDDAIARWRERDETDWRAFRVKECSLTPRLGRVVAIAWATPNGSGVDTAETEADEGATLRRFWEHVAISRQIAGFNSHGFDLPFLLTRSLILGVNVGGDVTPYLKRYNHSPHFDVRMALTGWDSRATGTLSDWCEAFGIPGKSGHGSQVYDLVTQGDWPALVKYAADDVNATAELVRRVGPTFGVNE